MKQFISLLLSLIVLDSWWKIFEAYYEVEGWKSIIPFYNLWIITEKTFGKGWYWLLMLIPVVGWVYSIYFYIKSMKALNQSAGMMLLCAFLPFVGYPMIAFMDKGEYMGIQDHLF